MIQIGHILPCASARGTEQMVLQLCKFRDRSRFSCCVGMPTDGVMAEEIRGTGATVYTGTRAYENAARRADLVNLHCWVYMPELHSLVESTGRPYVTTLHWGSTIPKIPALTICTSHYAHATQQEPGRCVTILNGIDRERFVPRPRRPREEIVITRVCDPSKCAPYFWKVMKQVLDSYPQARLRIVGDTAPGAESTDRVQFMGVRRDIPEILADSDIFFYTPYPGHGTKDLVVMEASATGLPCVVSDVNAVAGTVWDGINGFLTPFGDSEACLKAIRMLIEDSALRQRMRIAAVQLARQYFDAGDMCRQYEIVYQEVLSSGGARSRRRERRPRKIA